jgi:hypothetical protein
MEKPFFDYERQPYITLLKLGYSDPLLHCADSNNVKYFFKEKHLWIKKVAGLRVRVLS